MLLLELELPGGVRAGEGDGREDARDEGEQGEPEGNLLGAGGHPGREQPDDDGADERDGSDDGEPGDVGHHCITHTAPRMRTTPTSIVRA
jgi:hypothetical protein